METWAQFHQRSTYSFYTRRSQKRKKYSHQYLFTLSGSESVKAVHRTLMKLTPACILFFYAFILAFRTFYLLDTVTKQCFEICFIQRHFFQCHRTVIAWLPQQFGSLKYWNVGDHFQFIGRARIFPSSGLLFRHFEIFFE